MKKKYIFPIILATLLMLTFFAIKQPSVYADCAGASTTIISCDNGDSSNGINEILKMIFTILTYGTGALGVLGVVVVGIMYMTARDSTEQVAKAKKRMLEIAIGLVLFAGFGVITNWLVPGGIMIRDSSTNNSQTSTTGGTDQNNSQGSNSSTAPGANSGANNSNTATGDRQSGSESTAGMTGSVGSGSEGWVEQSSN